SGRSALALLALLAPLAPSSDDRYFYPRGILRCPVNLVRRRSEVALFGVEDIGHEGLRVAIDDRKPRALHLHHHAMPLLERVVLRMQAPRVFEDGIRRDGGRLLESRAIPASKDFVR